jgi:channel protein (hemolysin III family)
MGRSNRRVASEDLVSEDTELAEYHPCHVDGLVDRLGLRAVELLLLGGIFYSIGMVLLVAKRPRIAPRVFSYHEVFHILVVSGTLAHFLMIIWYVAPVARL